MPSSSLNSTAARRMSWLALFTLLCLPLLAGRAAARVPTAAAESPRLPVRYRITNLGVANTGAPLIAEALSNTGWIVGAYGEEDFLLEPFAWREGLRYNLAPLPGGGGFAQAQVLAVNDAGLAAGWSDNAFGLRRPVTWNQGTAPVDVLPGSEDYEEGLGINSSGAVAGRGSTLETPAAAAVWVNRTRTLLPDLGGEISEAYAINDAGKVVGLSMLADGLIHACSWQGGVATDLGTLGGFQSTAYAVNNPGLVAGSAETIEGLLYPAIWDGGLLLPLPVPPDHLGEAWGLNDSGHAVGYIEDFAFARRAARWIGGELLDLNSALPDNSGWVLEEARDINNSGQIIGVGQFFPPNQQTGLRRSFLLTPIAADLSLTATVQSGPVLVGRNLTYTLQVRNQGSDASPAATLSVSLPANSSFVAATPSATPENGTLTFVLGALARDAVQTFTITVQPTAAAVLTLDATVVGTEYDPDPADDHQQVTVTAVQPQADLRVSLAANPESGVVGNSLTYTVTVRNDGPHPAEETTLTATLPAGVELISTNPTATRDGDVLTFTLGTLAPQAVNPITVVVEPTAPGTLHFQVAVSSTTPDPDSSDNNTSLMTSVGQQAGPDLLGSWLSLYARGVGAGRARRSQLTGTLEVRNGGTLPAAASVVRIYVSADPVLDSGDAQVKELPVSALPAGQGVTLSVKATGPRGVDANGRYVLARLDVTTRVNESVEENNVVVRGPLPTQPDLTASWTRLTVTSAGPAARRRYTLRGALQVRNNGADSKPRFVVRYLLSTDAVPDAGDQKLRDATVGALGAGAVRSLALTSTLVPGVTVAGKYVLAVVDATSTVTETDETNNQAIHGPLK